MSLIRRVPAILRSPRRTWALIAQEPRAPLWADEAGVAMLAALPALAIFVGLSVVGFRTAGTARRLPIAAGLTQAAISYAASLIVVALLVLIVDALAPLFDARRDRAAALRLVAGASSAAFLGGIFAAVPAFAPLAVLGLLASVFLFYTGVPALMRCPPRNAAAYSSAMAVSAIVVAAAVGIALSRLSPLIAAAWREGPPPPIAFDRSTIPVIVERMEEASRRVAAAQQTARSTAPLASASDAGGASGPARTPAVSGAAAPIPAAEFAASLPETLAGMPRESIDSRDALPRVDLLAWAKASYFKEGRHIAISIVDLGGPVVIEAMRMRPFAAIRTDGAEVTEHNYNDGARAIRELAYKDARPSKFTIILGNGVMIEMSASRVGMSYMKLIYASMDVKRLEALKRPTRR